MPLLALVAMAAVVASFDEQHSQVARLATGMQAVIGLAIMAAVVVHASSDLRTLASLNTVRSVALVPVLSLLFVPCLYAVVLVSKYDSLFVRLNIGREKSAGLKRYARRRLLMYARLSMRRVDHLLGNHLADLARIETEADVDRLVAQMADS